jgi:hypothetical protein
MPQSPVHLGNKAAVFGDFLETLLADGAEHQDGIVAARLPKVSIQTLKQIDRVKVPVPVEVIGQFSKRF